tara:strand:+ start:316 stop:555 length:240 start_codon:yes stop_codon:yes gene_type:complete
MKKRNIKKLIESMTKKKKKKKPADSVAKTALIGRRFFSKGSDSMIRQAQTNYNGSYISGDLGGVSVSNPSLKKYYKGLI